MKRCPHCAAENLPGADVCDHCGSDLAGLDIPEAEGGFRGRLLTARLGDLKLSPAVVAAPEDTVSRAVERMREARSGCVLVFRDGELAGLFNERDLLTHPFGRLLRY
ncbi:MAG: CBS domain-containing protein, partial [Thermoanaerobaculia bacterium]|nr:CBS domain-containing protein [Thermoanaerobaculia bacterium]